MCKRNLSRLKNHHLAARQPLNLRQVEAGAALVFDAAGAEFYSLWVAEALPTYGRGQDAGGPLRYRAHLDCDGCR